MVHRRTALEAGFRGSFGIPITVKGRAIGVINFLSMKAHKFSPDEIRLIYSITDHLGVALENSELFEQVRRTAHEMEALVKTNRDIAALLNRDALLTRIMEEAIKLLRVDGGDFCLVAGEKLALHSARHAGDSIVEPGTSFAGRVIQENHPIATRDILQATTLAEEARLHISELGYRSYLGVPLASGERVLGSINLYSREEREFSDQEINLISAFAAQAAVAIENANLFVEIQKQANELKELNRELSEANQARSDFMAAMSHELRTPLQVIMGYSAMLSDGLGGKLTDTQREALDTIRHHSQVYLQLINNLLNLTKLEAFVLATLMWFHKILDEATQEMKTSELERLEKARSKVDESEGGDMILLANY
jgi:GAF domain-containing protein